MAYATVGDVQARMMTTMTTAQQNVCTNLLSDVAVLIDASNVAASADAKKVVSCNAVIRAMSACMSQADIPTGATQGSMSALGYSQSWTVSNGAVGELYLSRTDKKLLGVSNAVGSHSPLEDTEVSE